MKLLLDTHVLLWALRLDRRLKPPVLATIRDSANDVFVSAASAWEIAIKNTLGKLRAPEDLAAVLIENSFGELAVTVDHALAAGALPRHHDDPFDRMLVAQAMTEGLTLVSADRRLAAYNVALLPA